MFRLENHESGEWKYIRVFQQRNDHMSIRSAYLPTADGRPI